MDRGSQHPERHLVVIRIPNTHRQFIRRIVCRTNHRVGAAGCRSGCGHGFGPQEDAVVDEAVAVVEDVAYDGVEAGAE